MTAPLAGLAWPWSRLDEAVDLLARRIGTPERATDTVAPHAGASPFAGHMLDRLLFAHQLEAEPCTIRYRDADSLPAPLIVRLPETDTATAEPVFLVIEKCTRRDVIALGHDRRWRRVNRERCAAELRCARAAVVEPAIDDLLGTVDIESSRREGATRALLHEQLADEPVADAWRVAPDPGGAFPAQLWRAGVGRSLGWLAALHTAQVALVIVSWALLGRGALDGRIDWGWMTAWTLLLLTIVPLQFRASWIQGTVALTAGRLLRDRLLAGACRLKPEEIRHMGVGQLLGRVLESEAVETLAIGGGLQAGLAGIEILLAGVVLWLGAAGGPHVVLLVAVTLATWVVARAYHRQRRAWARSRLAMTHDLVECISGSGHRTRLAQLAPEHWHTEEDRALDAYLADSAAMDRTLPRLLVFVPRGWLALAIGMLVPAFVTGTAPAGVAVSLGGILLASLALRHFAEGLSRLSGAAIAWREVRPLFEAATRRSSPAAVDDAPTSDRDLRLGAALEVQNISFRYADRLSAVLTDCTLRAGPGDRVLIHGRSGGGKSTLASLIAGLRAPDAGLILVDGLDRGTLGADGWRRRVVMAPQFHENHIFSETLAFNLLVGRRWPPGEGDFEEAEAIARDLGLGDLLLRMPAGLLQQVGEGGWQLSHGERNRVFLARALLQGGGLMVLDESFAALDPETLRGTLACVLRRAPTLLVVAHP